MKRILTSLFGWVGAALIAIKGLFGVLGFTAVLHSSGIGIITGAAGFIAGTIGVIATILTFALSWPFIIGVFVVGAFIAGDDIDDSAEK